MVGLENQYKEWFSRSFLSAAAASAGVAMQLIQDDVFGVDLVLKEGYTSIDVQLKATSSPTFNSEGDLLFDLDVATYDKLRTTERDNSAYLVIAVVDPDRSRWVALDENGTVLRDRAYWLRLTGLPSTRSQSTVRLTVSREQTVTAESVRQLVSGERKALVS
jgi:hypothetical protein